MAAFRLRTNRSGEHKSGAKDTAVQTLREVRELSSSREAFGLRWLTTAIALDNEFHGQCYAPIRKHPSFAFDANGGGFKPVGFSFQPDGSRLTGFGADNDQRQTVVGVVFRRLE